MAKLNHTKLWMWVHFLGSAAIFALVLGTMWHIDWVSVGGAFEGTANNQLDLSVVLSTSYTYMYTNFSALLPVTAFIRLIFEGIASDGAFILTFAFGLDMVIWFNVMLWIVELMLFVPSWAFHYLEKVVKDGERKF